MSKKRVPRAIITEVIQALTDFQSEFSELSPEETQWLIQNTEEAIALFVKTIRENVIDGDADPIVYDKKTIAKHVKNGQLKWDHSMIASYIVDDESFEGSKNSLILSLNGNILDYLLANSQLIPKKWKSKTVFFYGTFYRSIIGSLYVRCLKRDDNKWIWSWFCISPDLP